LAHGGAVQAVAFSPDGQFVLTGSDDKTARLWRFATRQPVGEPLLHPHKVESVAFSHDGKTAFTVGRYGNDIHCWEFHDSTRPTGEQGLVRGRMKLTGHQGGVWSLAVTPRYVLSGSADRTARFWNASTGKSIGAPLQHQELVRDVAFGPDGRTALTGSFDNTARRWHAPSGIPIGPPFQHKGKIRAVALSPDGRSAGTASWDGTAALWAAPPARLGAPEQLSHWAQRLTGINLDDGGAVRTLNAAAWQQIRPR
jgi:eukaryotic-like serine/threonine-protein kinase